jgi:hypothetical protein
VRLATSAASARAQALEDHDRRIDEWNRASVALHEQLLPVQLLWQEEARAAEAKAQAVAGVAAARGRA